MPLPQSVYDALIALEKKGSMENLCLAQEYGEKKSVVDMARINMMTAVNLVAPTETLQDIISRARDNAADKVKFNKVMDEFYNIYSHWRNKAPEACVGFHFKNFLPGNAEVTEILGAGAHGVVILINLDGKEFAVKFTRGHYEAVYYEMYAQVMFVAAGLAPAVHDLKSFIVNDDDDIVLGVITMDTVEYTLLQLMCAAKDDKTRVVELVGHVTNLLGSLREAGMTHGDFHYQNIGFVKAQNPDTGDEEVKPLLIDFGWSDWTGCSTAFDVETMLATMRRKKYPHTIEFALGFQKMYDDDPTIPAHTIDTVWTNVIDYITNYRTDRDLHAEMDEGAQRFHWAMKDNADEEMQQRQGVSGAQNAQADDATQNAQADDDDDDDDDGLEYNPDTGRFRKKCPPGYHRNPKTGRFRKDCPEGYRRNAKTGMCRKKCGSGYQRSKKSRRCVKKCEPGFSRNTLSGMCRKKCGSGYKRSKKTGRCLKKCGPGQVRNETTQRCKRK